MKTFDVVIEQQNGHYRASVLGLPQLAVEAASRAEAIANAKIAIEEFFTAAEVATVAVDVPAEYASGYSRSADLRRWLEIYLPPLPDEANGETSAAAGQYPLAEKWLAESGISLADPHDPLYREFLVELAIEKQRQREEAERAAAEAEAALELARTAR